MHWIRNHIILVILIIASFLALGELKGQFSFGKFYFSIWGTIFVFMLFPYFVVSLISQYIRFRKNKNRRKWFFNLSDIKYMIAGTISLFLSLCTAIALGESKNNDFFHEPDFIIFIFTICFILSLGTISLFAKVLDGVQQKNSFQLAEKKRKNKIKKRPFNLGDLVGFYAVSIAFFLQISHTISNEFNPVFLYGGVGCIGYLIGRLYGWMVTHEDDKLPISEDQKET